MLTEEQINSLVDHAWNLDEFDDLNTRKDLSKFIRHIEAAVLQAQPTDQRLLNLLCRIHRDGGHYIAKHGLDKAVEDADIRVAEQNAALDAQAKQEPVAWCFVQNGFTHYTDDKRDWYDAVGVEEVTPLYAAPVVQPDMVMVPMEPTEAMIDAAMNRYKHVSPEAKARYTKMHRENFRCDYRAMIAAAEGKSNAVAHREAACGRSGGAEG